jgi:hypothetical protein
LGTHCVGTRHHCRGLEWLCMFVGRLKVIEKFTSVDFRWTLKSIVDHQSSVFFGMSQSYRVHEAVHMALAL